MKMLFKLFYSFAYIGAFTFGGGYSMLPMFRRVLVEKHKWLSDEEITDFFSAAQCLPGIIAVNTAVLTGYKQRKTAGGIAAAIGTVLPSLIVILIIAAFISNFADYPVVGHAFAGIRVCVCVLILNTVVKLWKQSIVDKIAIIIFIAVFITSVLTSLSAAILVIAAGVCGIAISFGKKKGAAK